MWPCMYHLTFFLNFPTETGCFTISAFLFSLCSGSAALLGMTLFWVAQSLFWCRIIIFMFLLSLFLLLCVSQISFEICQNGKQFVVSCAAKIWFCFTFARQLNSSKKGARLSLSSTCLISTWPFLRVQLFRVPKPVTMHTPAHSHTPTQEQTHN